MKKEIITGIFILFAAAPAGAGNTAKAVFAGGCFWCMTPPFEKKR